MKDTFFNCGLSLNTVLTAECQRVKGGKATKIYITDLSSGESFYKGTVKEYFSDWNESLREKIGKRGVFCTLHSSTDEYVVSIL